MSNDDSLIIDDEQDYEMDEDTLLESSKVENKAPSSLSPFIIQAQSNGIGGSRKVLANPTFDCFTRPMPSDLLCDTQITDLRQVVLNNRKSLTTSTNNNDKISGRGVCYSDLDMFETSSSTNKKDDELQMEIQSDEEKNRIENEKLEKLSLEIQCETDDERKYVLMIQKQKMEREQVIRQKEIKRKLEGWQFN